MWGWQCHASINRNPIRSRFDIYITSTACMITTCSISCSFENQDSHRLHSICCTLLIKCLSTPCWCSWVGFAHNALGETKHTVSKLRCVSGDEEGLYVYLRGRRTSCIVHCNIYKPPKTDLSRSTHKVCKAQKLLTRSPPSLRSITGALEVTQPWQRRHKVPPRKKR